MGSFVRALHSYSASCSAMLALVRWRTVFYNRYVWAEVGRVKMRAEGELLSDLAELIFILSLGMEGWFINYKVHGEMVIFPIKCGHPRGYGD